MSDAIYELRCEHLAAPLGIDAPYPRFSWKVKTVPLACRIQCGEWDSGEFAPGNMPVAYAGTPLLPQKKYVSNNTIFSPYVNDFSTTFFKKIFKVCADAINGLSNA